MGIIKKTTRVDIVLWSLGILFSVGYLILSLNLPVTIRTKAIYDDALFWNNAYQMVSGDWLGAYSKMTLAKGPGFPLFLAANAVLGTPVTLLIALLYLFACGLLARTLHDMGLKKYFIFIIFIIILFHPALFPIIIIRDNIYPALSLIIISGVLRLVFIPVQQTRQLFNIIPYGFVFGFFWVTREEGIWIIPGLLLLFFLKVLHLKKQGLSVKNVCYRLSLFSAAALISVGSIALINYHQYGKFEVVDFKGKAFSSALKSLNSVEAGADLPNIPVSFDKRQVIYKISPSFSQLKYFLEYNGKSWMNYGCSTYPWTCGDYAGGWFMWALRDAVSHEGYYKNPADAAEFYNKITREIKNSCNLGIIKCKTNPIPFMPNITLSQLKELPEKTLLALKLAMVQFPVQGTGGPSLEPLHQLQKVRLFLGNPHTTLALSEQNNDVSINRNSTDADNLLKMKDYSRQDLFLNIKNVLASLYNVIIPVLVLSGFFAYFIYIIFTVMGKRPISDIFIASTMMWCLFFARILLIVLVDISSFPAINALYMSAAYPIVCLAAFLSLPLLFHVMKSTGVSR